MVLRFFLLAIVFFASCTEPERNNPLDPDGVNYIGFLYSSSSVAPISSSSIMPSSSSIVPSSSSSITPSSSSIAQSSSSSTPSSSSFVQSSSSSSSVASSSSALPSSSSSVTPSSSSIAPSSSSIAPSSSSATPSSSSIASSSSFQSGIIIGDPIYYEGETYKTIIIGEQTWFQRNLNYAVEGSVCYDNDPANCAIYGRLYDWATAMALPISSNSSSIPSQIAEKHQGICPEGWHIPSDEDWNVWTGVKPNDYGFSAQMGGGGQSSGFGFGGKFGYWWTSTEFGVHAYHRYTNSSSQYITRDHSAKSLLYSVRCVKD